MEESSVRRRGRRGEGRGRDSNSAIRWRRSSARSSMLVKRVSSLRRECSQVSRLRGMEEGRGGGC